MGDSPLERVTRTQDLFNGLKKGIVTDSFRVS